MTRPAVYLDNSATTRVDDAVVEAMLPFFGDDFGNASSIHSFGQVTRAKVEDSRSLLAELLGAEPREIVFTSGGTESDNAALWGIFRSVGPGAHLITTKIEHPAILQTCKALEAAGASVTYLPVGGSGRVRAGAVADAIGERTVLISVMHANNETGVIQPIEEIATIAKARGILVHTDAVQSVGKIPVDVKRLGVDLLSLSAHKIHGPKGIGALYVRKGVKWVPCMTGGSQERKRRAGTENVPGIVGLGAAARLAGERLPEMSERVARLRDHVEQQLANRVGGVHVNGGEPRLPNVSNVSIEGIEGEAAVIALDLEGVAVSTGSACASGSLEPSHVLMAMGLRPEVVQSSLRFSLCFNNTREEMDRVIDASAKVCERLRRLSGRTAGGLPPSSTSRWS